MEVDLSFLLNKYIERAELTHDYLQLFFVDSSILNIFNSYRLDSELEKIKSSRLVGLQILENNIDIKLSCGAIISIDMSEDGYNGPEAMEYCANGQVVIIG